MANPTTNFGWVMPTSTSLVTNLPADFNTFGQGVDTSLQYLLGGTTGQVLSKTSGTNMAFTWVTPTDQTPLTTKGDLFTFTTVDARLGVGTNGYILSANSATATGLEWIAANPGDITAVTAGNGLSGGGTSGDVTLSINTAVTADLTTAQTLTNKTLTSPALNTPTISTLTTNGDLLYGTGSGAITRRAIGTTGQVLSVSGGVPTWTTPSSGAVVQVKSFFDNTNNTSSSTTYTDTAITLAITPTSASNKVLVIISASIYTLKSGAQTLGNTKLLRGATTLYTDQVTPYIVFGGSGSKEQNMRVTQVYLDSPATTSATTYKLQFAAESGGNIGTNTYSGGSTITLMEVTP
jgi:hypothetical protein